MGKIILLALLGGTVLVGLFQPWIAVIASYVFAVLTPQHIWFWHFHDVRPFLITAIPAVIGFCFAALTNRVDFSRMMTRFSLFFLTWWLFIALSFVFGAYVDVPSRVQFFIPEDVLVAMSKVFFFFFLAVLLIDSDRKFRYLVYVIIFSVIYLTYWANMQYLEGRIYEPRLRGPMGLRGGTVYKDENAFAMFFVTGLPFLYYWGLTFKNRLWRYAVWLVIPFGWHAIFLTGSRGGLIGLGVTLLIITLRSKRAFVGLLIVPLFVVAYMWQAGELMKGRSETVRTYEEDRSAQARFESWTTAGRMIATHPITGVGVASFGPAYAYFTATQPHEAHNTFLQISAESGLPAGLSWLAIVVGSIWYLWRRSSTRDPQFDSKDDRFVFAVEDALLASMCGFAVCSIFLSLQGMELFFYYGVLLAYVRLRAARTEEQEARRAPLPAKANGLLRQR